MTLALDGGTAEVKGLIRSFNTIGKEEIAAAAEVISRGVLSGYLGGERRGGYFVRKLEDTWAERFGTKFAVACNSATSALLAACAAVGVKTESDVLTTPFTMSATSAAPALLGGELVYRDIEPATFNMNIAALSHLDALLAHAVMTANIFGHPSELHAMREWCETRGIYMIEDNSQSPFAKERGRYAGTIGHIGCWSLNVHKHIHAGEGGIATTDDEALASAMWNFVNHGELAGDRVGLNLRMGEVSAAIALAQLAKAPAIMADRTALAEALTAAVRGLPGLTPPVVREGCSHVYYCWALKVDGDRDWFVRAMAAEGVPLRAGYVDPLYRLPAFSRYARPCPVAEEMHDKRIVLFEVCAHSPTPEQIKQIGSAFAKVAERMRVEA